MAFLPLFVFIFGLIIGSFLNVVILRMNTGRSLVVGRSACPRCNRSLLWNDLIPVFSFLNLRGKCRGCKAPISFQYPVVELLTAVLFVTLYSKLLIGMEFSSYAWLSFLFGCTVASLLIVAAIYDARHKILPDVVIYPFLLLSLGSIVVKGTLFSDFNIITTFIEGLLVALPLFLLWALSRGRGMGFGDVKLVLGIGWLFGFSMGIAGLFFAFWIGAIFGLFLIALSHRHGMKSHIPFGPFLMAGALIAFLWDLSINTIFPML